MPKIQAPTVAEHRAAQRAALLDAARSLLSEEAERAPSMAAVARRAGLARSSVYAYFTSRDDLLDALIVDTFPRWSAYVRARMGKAGTPGDRVLAYVHANLRLVARGDHALARALAATGRTDALANSSRLLHDELQTPLRTALADHGAGDPDRTAELVQSIVYTLSRMIEDGLPERAARRLADELLTPYLNPATPHPA
ncbi:MULTISPECIES: TetR/AcrR family transcriptional regulator [Actinomadura]|uniref:TetR/AcrR family transcriptional regulator n=1 Tax=Actinomadura geliboluensis TaxID=882440 RepID=A0A5S4GVM0_9ACTN|nr:TetR/AcrR family transcriptional regulator [Actinomadura geliboluensis]TMR36782.1 TetR/AcrR family transcriptional regulator [Actinomadura geliboluensis]